MSNLLCAGKSDPGLLRSNNEDAFGVRPDLGLCVLADGMGGAAAGEIASRIFVEAALEVFSRPESRSEKEAHKLIQAAFELAHDRILNHIETQPQHRGMGCTAELLILRENGYVLGHVGDSRSYLFRKGQLKRLTKDHSLIQEQLDKELITPHEARKHPLRNVILRAVGIEENLALDLIRGVPQKGDTFLLCSDGLTDMIEESAIVELLSSPGSIEEKAARLVESAKSAGGRDNITVVLAQIA
ncbi:MAG: Stp1/IreP family PP2C-type Ser/Thr phosphatase [Pseudomonadota bacterium]